MSPKCPRPERLRAMMVALREDEEVNPELYNEVISALDWLTTQLENRTLYHKRQQIKKKIVFALAREHGLDVQAETLTNDALFNHVANQPSDGTEEFPTNDRAREEDQD